MKKILIMNFNLVVTNEDLYSFFKDPNTEFVQKWATIINQETNGEINYIKDRIINVHALMNIIRSPNSSKDPSTELTQLFVRMFFGKPDRLNLLNSFFNKLKQNGIIMGCFFPNLEDIDFVEIISNPVIGLNYDRFFDFLLIKEAKMPNLCLVDRGTFDNKYIYIHEDCTVDSFIVNTLFKEGDQLIFVDHKDDNTENDKIKTRITEQKDYSFVKLDPQNPGLTLAVMNEILMKFGLEPILAQQGGDPYYKKYLKYKTKYENLIKK